MTIGYLLSILSNRIQKIAPVEASADKQIFGRANDTGANPEPISINKTYKYLTTRVMGAKNNKIVVWKDPKIRIIIHEVWYEYFLNG